MGKNGTSDTGGRAAEVAQKGFGLRGEEVKQNPQKQGTKMMRKEVIRTWREKEHFSNFPYLR